MSSASITGFVSSITSARMRAGCLRRVCTRSERAHARVVCALARWVARIWTTGLRQHDADDLLNEALDRVLSGRRPWFAAVQDLHRSWAERPRAAWLPGQAQSR
jgi:hypothetical protein